MPHKRSRILCVEGNEDIRVVVALLFEAAGCEAITAGGTQEALLLATTEEFDLCLIAYKLTDGTGVELCRKLRELRPQMPILFWSALVYPADRQQAISAGANAFLKKPDDLGILVETVSHLMKMRQKKSASVGQVIIEAGDLGEDKIICSI